MFDRDVGEGMVSISGGKSIGESVEATEELSLLERPLSCWRVSRTLGTYREWGSRLGLGGREGCSPLPITSSDIQANILPLPVTPSRCVYSLRTGVLVRVRRFLYSPLTGIFEGPPRGKRMSSLLQAERKFPLAIFNPPTIRYHYQVLHSSRVVDASFATREKLNTREVITTAALRGADRLYRSIFLYSLRFSCFSLLYIPSCCPSLLYILNGWSEKLLSSYLEQTFNELEARNPLVTKGLSISYSSKHGNLLYGLIDLVFNKLRKALCFIGISHRLLA